ncbi:pentatricopeptide repeat-containing protein At1g15510, chloroplastic [Cryptomeria japonica]|uniref:pentatricopeptide repeat-containing protein At1g15510, chloroplastic n=1 Tax=Cryptomeria japonica TaxID=3369 RepID=UPI0027DA712A|nr:pentatricopeptide repeat-containing protein At1g15510, chloroplastic [Cryptomeria japonica]
MPSTADLNLMVLCKRGRLKETIHNRLITRNLTVLSSVYFQQSQSCIAKNATSQHKKMHSIIIDGGFAYAACTFIQNNLMNMYVKTGSFVDARKVFDEMTERDVSSWNIIIAAYRRHANHREALTLFNLMQRTETQPDQFTFASILPACAKVRAVEQGMSIHQSIVERRFLSDLVVVSALIDMYGKCGKIDKARKLFDKMPQRNTVSWNALIAGYAQNGILERVLESFKRMQLAGVKPVSATFASILPACAKMGALEEGMEIHRCTIECGFLSDLVVANALLDMYAKCRSVHKACNLFDKMPHRDVVSWNAMIAGYAQNGFDGKALETFKEMHLAALEPDSTTFASILPACAKMGALKRGMNIHQSIIESSLLSDVIVASALVDMYAKCGDIHKASELFTQMPQRNVVSWNAMIAGYAQNGFVEEALNAFNQMKLAGVKPVSRTFASILPACAKVGALEQGMDIHQSIIESGLLSDVVLASSLVDMYAKCGNIYKARELFDKMCQRNVISWNAMIAGYAQNGFYKDALDLFQLMMHSGTHPDHKWAGGVKFKC